MYMLSLSFWILFLLSFIPIFFIRTTGILHMKVFLTEQASEETPVDTCLSGTGVKETYLGRV